MSQRNLYSCLLAVLFTLSIAVSTASASELEDLNEAYGLVTSIKDGQMTVAVYDPKKDETHDEIFTLSDQTEIVIIRPATEVIEGDEVRIAYKDEKKEKVTRFISVLDLPEPENADL